MSRLRERGMQTSIGRTEQLANNIGRLPRLKGEYGKRVIKNARIRVHVITGFLKSTIDIFGEDEKSITFGASASYARHEEEGTSKRPPHSFLRPAVKEEKKWLRERIKELTRKK